MKKSLVLIIFILSALGMVACSNVATNQTEIERLQAEITQLKNKNKELETSLADAIQKIDVILKSTNYEIS